MTPGKQLFGTDGIRGVAGEFPLDPETLSALGQALVHELGAARSPGRNREIRILIGRDTRESGPWIQEALIAGVRRAGGAADPIGVITTPGLAYLAGAGGYDAGVMISASHNPFRDNGIKIFGSDQLKLSDVREHGLEEAILGAGGMPEARAAGASRPELVGVVPGDDPAVRDAVHEPFLDLDPLAPSSEENATAARLLGRYRAFLIDSVSPGTSFAGLRVALDCANGAACEIAPAVFSALGAEVRVIGAEPSGRNINASSGALHPEHLAEVVRAGALHVGFAFDGDADRCVVVDRTGRILDGDFILYIEAMRLDGRGLLAKEAVVGTVMSNLWLEKKLADCGIRLLRTPVGDKYVLDKMLEEEVMLGGEQSGHIIFLDRSRAGDGILTALRLAEAISQDGADLARIAEGIERYPQILLNVPVASKPPLESHPEIGPVIRDVEQSLAGRGRVLVRYSGTERLARVMVEGMDAARIEAAAHTIADAIRQSLGS